MVSSCRLINKRLTEINYIWLKGILLTRCRWQIMTRYGFHCSRKTFMSKIKSTPHNKKSQTSWVKPISISTLFDISPIIHIIQNDRLVANNIYRIAHIQRGKEEYSFVFRSNAMMYTQQVNYTLSCRDTSRLV